MFRWRRDKRTSGRFSGRVGWPFLFLKHGSTGNSQRFLMWQVTGGERIKICVCIKATKDVNDVV